MSQNNQHETCVVKPSTYTDSSKEINDKDPKFKIGDIVRTSKYKNIFAKGQVPNWCEEVFVVKKVKNTLLWTCVISNLKGEKLVEAFFEKELQKESKRVQT